jgi:hypothetical protein
MKLPKIPKMWLIALLIALPVMPVAYWFGYNFADGSFEASLAAIFGLDPSTQLHRATFGAAALLVFLSFAQALILVVSRYHASFSKASGIEAMLGEGKKGRASLWPLAWFHAANGTFICLLTYGSVAKVSQGSAVAMIVIAIICAIAMVFSSARLLTIMDEMLRRIWVEATALTCGLILLGAMFANLLATLGWLEVPNLLKVILIYNFAYMVIYSIILALRAPASFTNPNLEAQ